ncbi:Protein of unknown function [Gryllus bimaculatus]|nr:Protein of unknown function [Gryllus bimaculatus]
MSGVENKAGPKASAKCAGAEVRTIVPPGTCPVADGAARTRGRTTGTIVAPVGVVPPAAESGGVICLICCTIIMLPAPVPETKTAMLFQVSPTALDPSQEMDRGTLLRTEIKRHANSHTTVQTDTHYKTELAGGTAVTALMVPAGAEGGTMSETISTLEAGAATGAAGVGGVAALTAATSPGSDRDKEATQLKDSIPVVYLHSNQHTNHFPPAVVPVVTHQRPYPSHSGKAECEFFLKQTIFHFQTGEPALKKPFLPPSSAEAICCTPPLFKVQGRPTQRIPRSRAARGAARRGSVPPSWRRRWCGRPDGWAQCGAAYSRQTTAEWFARASPTRSATPPRLRRRPSPSAVAARGQRRSAPSCSSHLEGGLQVSAVPFAGAGPLGPSGALRLKASPDERNDPDRGRTARRRNGSCRAGEAVGEDLLGESRPSGEVRSRLAGAEAGADGLGGFQVSVERRRAAPRRVAQCKRRHANPTQTDGPTRRGAARHTAARATAGTGATVLASTEVSWHFLQEVEDAQQHDWKKCTNFPLLSYLGSRGQKERIGEAKGGKHEAEKGRKYEEEEIEDE